MDLVLPEHHYLLNIAVIGIIGILVGLPWAVALTHILTHKFEGYQKELWVIVLFTTGITGAITYFIVGWRRTGNK